MAGLRCTFREFYHIWAKLEGWKVPAFHEEMIEWLSNYHKWKGHTGVLQIARNHGKSTMVGVFVAWVLTQDPTFRFLIISEKKSTATKMVAHIIGIIKRHPVANCLYDKNNPTEMWRADSIKVIGYTDERSASVESQGIGSAITGARADMIIFDDVEGPKNSATAAKREKLRTALKEPMHVLNPSCPVLYIGTPHAQESIYPELIGEVESTTDEDISHTEVSSLKMPGMSNTTGDFPNIVGTPLWPERFGLDVYLEKQQASGKKAISKGNFLSQYLLIPYRVTQTTFDSNDLVWYDSEVQMSHEGRAFLNINGKQREMVGMKVFWDPSLGHTSGSAVSIVLQDDIGNNYNHWTGRIQKEPDEQCRFVIGLAQAFHFSTVTIESNGIGGFMIRTFRKEAVGSGITCVEHVTKGDKKTRIVEIIRPRLQMKMLYAHNRMKGTAFEKEFNDFNTTGERLCDTVDAFASCIELQPIRIKIGQAGRLKHQFSGGWKEPVSYGKSRRNQADYV
jgi:hypothetical protein